MSLSLQQIRQHYQTKGSLPDLPEQHFINGQWSPSDSGEYLDCQDPCTGQRFARIAAGNSQDVEMAVAAANQALTGWKQTAPAQRAEILQHAANLLEQHSDFIASVEALDVGKPLHEAQSDVASSVRALRYYAGACDKLQGDSFPLGADNMSFSMLEAVGVTAHIIPWNFPLSTTIRGVAPALAAGCTAIVKPAETTSLSALLLADLFRQAGLPAGVYNVVTGLGKDVGAPLVAHPDIHHVTFTGSVATGSQVMQAAAVNVNSVTMELGGKSPLVVMADADLDEAAEGVVWAIFYNAGQICSAGSRLVVDEAVHKPLLDKVLAKVAGLRIDHSLNSPDFGAINSAIQLEKISGFVERAKARGVSLLCGGEALTLNGAGWFYAPTIFDRVDSDDELVQEEIFGPVLSVQVVDGIDQAISAANCTNFALAAGIYTANVQHALRFARDVDAGQITVNDYWAGGIEVPFGGNKSSGFGREKGLEALRNYCRTKAVTFKV